MNKLSFFAVARFGAAVVLGTAVTASAWAQSGRAPSERVKLSGQGANQPEVVGGRIAKPGRWPFMVATVDKQIASNREAQWCGGTLISKRDVLTAGHCAFPGEEGLFDVLVGTQDLASGGRRIAVVRITQHPDYNSRDNFSDVSVLRLAEDVTDIEPVTFMTTETEEEQYAPVGRKSWGIGWGETETIPHAPRRLHEVNLPIVDRDVCNAPDSYNGAIQSTMICAGYAQGGKDTCYGDSGSPLLVRGAGGQWNLQVGVVSWGEGCAEPNYYGVYARLATLGAWVKEQIAAP
jgi:secreted trypsin-like serine protease